MSGERSLSERKRWWASFALLAAAGLAWAFATPIFAAPDEPYHVIRAASVGRGELLGEATPRGKAPAEFGNSRDVGAPGIYENADDVACFAFRPNRTPNCFEMQGPDREITISTYVGSHPPAYYGFVGFFSRPLSPGDGQVYLMRIVGALAMAALLASCVVTITRFAVPMWAGTGLAVALTPMVYFLAGTVSPSGIETAAAVGVWTHGAVLAADDDALGSRVLDRLGIAAAILVLSRALSPLWLVVIAAILLLLVDRSRLLRIVRHRRAQVWAVVVVAAVVVQAWWNFYADPLDRLAGTPVKAGWGDLVRTSFGKTPQKVEEMIGVFGWLDTRSPTLTFAIWTLAVGALAGLVLVFGGSRYIRAFAAAFAAVLVLPVVIESVGADRAGFIWQGRYSLPLAVGVPLLAGFGLASSETMRAAGRRFPWVVVAALGLAQVLAFGQALRRYAVGAKGPLWFFGDARWDPPVPAPLLVLGYAVVVAVLTWLFVLGPVRARTPRLEDERIEEPVHA
jgi:hypothetical protein